LDVPETEILVSLLSHLSPKSLFNVAAVCKKLNNVVYHHMDSIWKLKFWAQLFPSSTDTSMPPLVTYEITSGDHRILNPVHIGTRKGVIGPKQMKFEQDMLEVKDWRIIYLTYQKTPKIIADIMTIICNHITNHCNLVRYREVIDAVSVAGPLVLVPMIDKEHSEQGRYYSVEVILLFNIVGDSWGYDEMSLFEAIYDKKAKIWQYRYPALNS